MPDSVLINYENMTDTDRGLTRYLSVIVTSMVINHEYDALQALIDDMELLTKQIWDLIDGIDKFRQEYEEKVKRRREAEEQLAQARAMINEIDNEIQSRYIEQMKEKDPSLLDTGRVPADSQGTGAGSFGGVAPISEPVTTDGANIFGNFEVVGGDSESEDDPDFGDLGDLDELDEIGIDLPDSHDSGYMPIDRLAHMSLGGTELDDEPEEAKEPEAPAEPAPATFEEAGADNLYEGIISPFDGTAFEDDDADSPDEINGSSFFDSEPFGNEPSGGDFNNQAFGEDPFARDLFDDDPFSRPPGRGEVAAPPSFASLERELYDDGYDDFGGGRNKPLGGYDSSQFIDDEPDNEVPDDIFFS